jgi:hypothetical protein
MASAGLAALHTVALFLSIAAKSPEPPTDPGPVAACPPDAICIGQSGFAGETLIAGRRFHWHYKTTVYKALVAVDVPSLLVATIVSVPLFWLPEYHFSYVLAALWLLFGGCQWWLIGGWLRRRFTRYVGGACIP